MKEAAEKGKKDARLDNSSVPSVFSPLVTLARALELADVDFREEKGSVSEANAMVSRWLDLMEMVFTECFALEFERWPVAEQIKCLSSGGFREVAEALRGDIDRLFGGQMSDIYLIKLDGKVIGGTSPYTFVYPAVGWNSGKPVRSLLDRDKRFRHYLYRQWRRLESERFMPVEPLDTEHGYSDVVGSFRDYVGRCLDAEQERTLTARFKPGALDDLFNYKSGLHDLYDLVDMEVEGARRPIEVASLKCGSADDTSCTMPMNLFRLPSEGLHSDLFVDSDDRDTDLVSLPLLLDRNIPCSLVYYDDVLWPGSGVDLLRAERGSGGDGCRLPGCYAYRHEWLTAEDFLEPLLLSLPYEMDDEGFHHVINHGGRSYLLPLKQGILKYFTPEHVRELISWTVADNVLEFTLRIPVRNNDGTRRNVVPVTERYDLSQDVIDAGSMAVGISPMARIPLEWGNSYDVMLQRYGRRNDQEARLEFYNGLGGEPLSGVSEAVTDGECGIFKCYRVAKTTFDIIALLIGKDDRKVSGMLMPHFKEAARGTDGYTYGIDAGADSMKISYVTSQRDEPKNFGSAELISQVQYTVRRPGMAYLMEHSAEGDMRVDAYGKDVDASPLVANQDRKFYPMVLTDEYSFPAPNILFCEDYRGKARIFADASIGFRYTREIRSDHRYRTGIRWRGGMYGPVNDEGQVYIQQTLMMVRNHWLMSGNADFTRPPSIVVAEPSLCMAETVYWREVWRKAYLDAFGEWKQAGDAGINFIPKSHASALLEPSVGFTYTSLYVDIGATTTTFHCHHEYKIYTGSVDFGTDDLWGATSDTLSENGKSERDNVFTRLADKVLSGRGIRIDLYPNEVVYDDIVKRGKALVDTLLRDGAGHFSKILTSYPENSDARTVMFLHYGAIVYHLVNWLEKAGIDVSSLRYIVIKGLGSGYINLLFQQNYELQRYTERLIKSILGYAAPLNIKISIEPQSRNDAAAGAARSKADYWIRDRMSRISTVIHHGFSDSETDDEITWEEAGALADKVAQYFDGFVKAFTSVTDDELQLPKLTDAQIEAFAKAARYSFRNMADGRTRKERRQVDDSMFFWMLKKSLGDFDMYPKTSTVDSAVQLDIGDPAGIILEKYIRIN